MANHAYRLRRALADLPTSSLGTLLGEHRSVLGSLLLFSAVVNVMALAVSLFSMQIFDRVLTAQSRDTLAFLTLAVVLAISLSATLEWIRQLTAGSLARWMSSRIAPALLAKSLEQRLASPGTRLEALRALTTVNSFLSTPTLFSVIDMLWVPIYLLVIVGVQPLLGALAAVGVIILLGLAFLNERGTRRRHQSGQSLTTANLDYAESLLRNSEVIDAMGMSRSLVDRWAGRYELELTRAERPRHFSTTITALARFIRYFVQVALLGVGALLVLDRELTGGAMIAASIITGRLMAPIESSISYWKQFVLARQAYSQIDRFCALPPLRTSAMRLPQPNGDIVVGNLAYLVAGVVSPILRGVSFELGAGELLALVGPSGSGKTTLSRLLIGILPPTQGHVRLDGADIFDWMRSDVGPHIGYLPQDVELLPGTVRDNIARFRTDASDEAVVAAAMLADCHDMILQLEAGYETELSDGGQQLSAGQRQRIGLARALFGSPRLVVLDEPNASLDAAGETALFAALGELKRQRVTTVVVSHRTNILRLADKVLVLEAGRVTRLGSPLDVVGRLSEPAKGRVAGPQASAAPQPEEQRQ